ncbi:SDR family NAD(P)-dependent oxidoreductase [Paenibacillus rhizoplanae]
MNTYSYQGKLAVVTGASSGIGEVYAGALAARGCHVVLAARSAKKLQALAGEIQRKYGVQAYALPCDLAKAGAPRQLAESIAALGLTVDILINNAGIGTHGRFEEIDPEREQAEIILNTAALVDLTHHFLPGMLERKDGVVVNVASMAAFAPCAYSAVYGATKAFVLSFSEALWAETRGRGVRVLTLCPGATDTGFFSMLSAAGTWRRVAHCPLQRKSFKPDFAESTKAAVISSTGEIITWPLRWAVFFPGTGQLY